MLSVIPVPVGNREDITMRAMRMFNELDIFFCEDTRMLQKLFRLYDIDRRAKKMYSLNSFSSEAKLAQYIALLQEKNAGLVSDAGTPWLSDPWKSLIKLCWEWSIPFEVLPGATALIPAVVASYCDTSKFVYLWFPPTKKGRQTFLQWVLQYVYPVYIYESVHRVDKTLKQLGELWFIWKVFMGREISKMHEQHERGTIEEMRGKIETGEITMKWEFVLWFLNEKEW